ncbi:MAG: iron-containing alcohol dehydrogenase [Candidatus Pacebacteria bacterium]|nr:iron-containing alcohol dehydrogenase [Candidatus Paceibacterota bacterium]
MLTRDDGSMASSTYHFPFDGLGTSFRCSACGEYHTVHLRYVDCSSDCLQSLPRQVALCVRDRELVLLADTRTYDIVGREAIRALDGGGYKTHCVILPDPSPGGSPVCDDQTLAWIKGQVLKCPFVLAAGSGVLNDLAKWLALDWNVPYGVVATAPSMNGYASDNIAPTVKGVKTLITGRGPLFVLARPKDLANAPAPMIAAGLGDFIAKSVSALDWRMNHIVFNEFYCAYCVELIQHVEDRLLAHPEMLKQREVSAVRMLFEGLLLAGIGMSMAGTSAPASGGEHLISHTLDMKALADGRPHDLHGRQVGVGTIVAAVLYDQVFSEGTPWPDPCGTIPAFSPIYWGTLAEAVRPYAEKKRRKAERAVARLTEGRERRQNLRDTLTPLRRDPYAIKAVLKDAGAAHTLDDIGVDHEAFNAVLLHAHEIRERFTIIDLAWLTGVGVNPAVINAWLRSEMP